jgi:glyceraldehyde 3-phosphate dehydrogenase
VEVVNHSIMADGKRIEVLSEPDPAKINWRDYGVDIVIESTGEFNDGLKASDHLKGGAKKVIIPAPAKNEDWTIVLGVNESEYDPDRHHIVSSSSCTTNCIAPAVKALHQEFGVKRGLMTTIHAYTNDQVVLDARHRDLRLGRAAGMNIIPTTTGAARAVSLVIPELRGKLHGRAFRVPVPSVSIIDFVADLNRDATAGEINAALKAASEGSLAGILDYCDEPLVSVDFKGNSASSILDALSTMVIAGNMIKILAWYDNEWGYSCRVAELAAYIASKGI